MRIEITSFHLQVPPATRRSTPLPYRPSGSYPRTIPAKSVGTICGLRLGALKQRRTCRVPQSATTIGDAMARIPAALPMTGIELDRRSPVPLSHQLADQLRTAI